MPEKLSNDSKYLRDPNEKKSKYERLEDESKSKYLKDENKHKEYHYNLARNYKEKTDKRVDSYSKSKTSDNNQPRSKGVFASSHSGVPKTAAPAAPKRRKAKSDEFDIIDEISQVIGVEEIESKQVKSDNSNQNINNNVNNDYYKNYNNNAQDDDLKGDSSALFKHSGISKETAVAHVNNKEEDTKKNIVIKTIVIMVLLTVIAGALQFATITSKYFPTMINVEFSVFPELIASIAYGPIYGLLIVFVKNLFHILVVNNGFVSEMSNFVLDSIFIFTVGFIYNKRMFATSEKLKNKTIEKNKRQKIFFGGLIASLLTTVASFFLTKFVSYPIFLKQYANAGFNEQSIIDNYQYALNKLVRVLPQFFSGSTGKISSVTQAILYYNVPVTLTKFIFVTIIASIVYVVVSPYLHFKKKSKK